MDGGRRAWRWRWKEGECTREVGS